MKIRRNLNGPYPQGVVNPYTAHVHPYPTRYHGPIYTRPVFGLPYVRSPHAVFKPDDFSDYYDGVKGLGSFSQGSSIGNGTIGGNTLGLGATGSPIYYRASSTNSKVSTLQTNLNVALVSKGYPQIPVSGKLDAITCAATQGLYVDGKIEGVDSELLAEAMNVCNIASRDAMAKKDILAQLDYLLKARNPVPAATVTPTPVLTTPSQPEPSQAITTAPVPAPVVVTEEAATPEYAPVVLDFPEMEIEARAEDKSYGKMPIILGAVAVSGIAYYLMSRK